MRTFTRRPRTPSSEAGLLFVPKRTGGYVAIRAGTAIGPTRVLPSTFSGWWWKEPDAEERG